MNTTFAGLGWYIAAFLVAGSALEGFLTWFLGRYEVTAARTRPRGPFRLRVTRRWYGRNAHVCLREEEDSNEAARHLVLGWDKGQNGGIPWLHVQNIDDEDARSRWAPVTDFAPYTVRRLRPHILRTEHCLFPQLFGYRPLRRPSGYLEGGRDAA